jgi:hypothetical protein
MSGLSDPEIQIGAARRASLPVLPINDSMEPNVVGDVEPRANDDDDIRVKTSVEHETADVSYCHNPPTIDDNGNMNVTPDDMHSARVSVGSPTSLRGTPIGQCSHPYPMSDNMVSLTQVMQMMQLQQERMLEHYAKQNQKNLEFLADSMKVKDDGSHTRRRVVNAAPVQCRDFSGSEGEDPRLYVENFRRFKDLTGIPDNMVSARFSMALTGSAGQWWTANAKRLKDLPVEQMFQEFITSFSSGTEGLTLSHQIYTTHQTLGQPVSQFAYSLQEKIIRFDPDMSETQRGHILLAALHPDIAGEVVKRLPDTISWATVLEAARREEANQRIIKDMKTKTPTPSTISAQSQVNMVQVASPVAADIVTSPSDLQALIASVETLKKRFDRNGRPPRRQLECFLCRGPHKISECPHRGNVEKYLADNKEKSNQESKPGDSQTLNTSGNSR